MEVTKYRGSLCTPYTAISRKLVSSVMCPSGHLGYLKEKYSLTAQKFHILSHLFTHCQLNHQGLFGVQHHFGMQTGGAGDQTADPLVSGPPFLPPTRSYSTNVAVSDDENIYFSTAINWISLHLNLAASKFPAATVDPVTSCEEENEDRM